MERSEKEVSLMLGNNNKKILNKLAKNTLRRNKKQMSILFLTICLSAFMLFSVFTLGITYLDLSRQQDTRLNGAEYDIALMNGFTEQQKESLEENSFTRSVGTESYAGYVKSTEYDDTVDTGLLWCDQTFWEEQMAPARTKTEGFYPQEKNQLMVTREGLKALGKEDLQIGDSLSLTYEDNTGIHTGEFVISGIWDGYGDKAPVFVSEEFYKQSGYRLEYDGILCIKLKQDFLLPGTIDKIEDSLELSERQAFQPSPYIENSLKILAGIWGLSAVICLSAYLLIYNILYLSVSGKIRYYGLLQALGMTRRQLMMFMKKQMLLISTGGIAAGIILGTLTSLVLVPSVMKILGISVADMKLSFRPSILLASAAISGIAVFLGIRKPVGTAADTSPVEAVKYRGIGNTRPGSRKIRKKNLLWTMAWEQIRKDKKKSAVVFLSLAASLQSRKLTFAIMESLGMSDRQIRKLLQEYISDTYEYQNNTFYSHPGYYIDYFEMWMKQLNILHNLHYEIKKMRNMPLQAQIVAEYILYMAEYVVEFNSPEIQLERLEKLFENMKKQPLPKTREEFESRAVLYHVLMDLEEFLTTKKRFVRDLDEKKRRLYWKE